MERVISVPDMHCDALNAAELKFSVSLENKTVTIDGCEHCLATALREIEDLGFTPKAL